MPLKTPTEKEGWSSQESIFRGIPGQIEFKRFLEGKKKLAIPTPLQFVAGSPRRRTNWSIGSVRTTFKYSILIGNPNVAYQFTVRVKITENGVTPLGESARVFNIPAGMGFFVESDAIVFDIEFFAPPVIKGGNALQGEVILEMNGENKEEENTFLFPVKEGVLYVNYTAEFESGGG